MKSILCRFLVGVVACATIFPGPAAPAVPLGKPPSTFGANSSTINNRYYPLTIGSKRTMRGFGVIAGYSGTAEVVGVETVDGIRCLRVNSRGPDGLLYTWYAQDTSGAVWQLRNYDPVYKDYDHEDYLIMPPAPKAGEHYTLWHLDYEVVSTSERVSTPAGTFSGCLHLKSIDSSWPDLQEYYAPGVGELKLVDSSGGYQLVSASGLPPATYTLAGSIRQGAVGGPPMVNVAVRLTASGLTPRTTKTDAAGRFQFSGLRAKTYTVTPSGYGLSFVPSQQTAAVTADTDLPAFIGEDHTSVLTLVTNGNGRITRSFTGDRLLVGSSYTVKAIPGAGNLFSNWTDGASVVLTNHVNLRFLMQPDMVLQANFVPNPYPALKGAYVGLFRPPSEETVSGTNAGSITLTLADSGAFSGSVRLAGKTHPFSGRFDVGRRAAFKVTRLGNTPLAVSLGFDGQTIAGEVSTVGWAADLLILRRTTSTSNVFAGRYSMLVMGQHDATDSPPGDSPLAVSISAPSNVSVSGTMADGSAITLATGHSAEGTWPFYASLYGGRGLVIGWMSCEANPAPQEVLWVKPPDTASRYYPAGFREERLVALQRYLPPAPKQSPISWSTGPGRLLIGGGNLPEPLEAEVFVTNNLIKRVSGSVSNLSLVITNSNGRFGGSFMHPVTRKPVTVRGILVQGLPWLPPSEQVTVGGGWFIGTTNQDGYLWLEPNP